MGVACSLIPRRGLGMRLCGMQFLFCLLRCLLQLASVRKPMPSLKVSLWRASLLHSAARPQDVVHRPSCSHSMKSSYVKNFIEILFTNGWKFAKFVRLKTHEKFALYCLQMSQCLWHRLINAPTQPSSDLCPTQPSLDLCPTQPSSDLCYTHAHKHWVHCLPNYLLIIS